MALASSESSAMRVLVGSFLGKAPEWYKLAVIGALIANFVVFFTLGPLVTGWMIMAEFIVSLAMALKCFPLQPGGLLALQAVVLGLTNSTAVYHEVEHGLPVLLLVIFMVAGVHFLRDMLYLVIGHLLLSIRSPLALNMTVMVVVSLASAFLDALTILAVLVAVAMGFYEVYNRALLSREPLENARPGEIEAHQARLHDMEAFRAMLRGILMHGAIGTAIGGVCTLVGEPENIVIGTAAGWDFAEFFVKTAPLTIPTLLAGFGVCWWLETRKGFGYGAALPDGVRQVLLEEVRRLREERTPKDRFVLRTQMVVALLMVLGLAFHVAEIGLIGLAAIILVSAFAGITDEHRLGEAFAPGLPFASLLVVFYVIVSMIGSLHMFDATIAWALSLDDKLQVFMIFLSNGAMSAISDNVFVAAVYTDELKAAFDAGMTSRALFDAQSAAVVMGTGIPSMATPNGQAAFLYLLTSPIAPLIRLGYGRMFWMALPYAIVTTLVAALCVG